MRLIEVLTALVVMTTAVVAAASLVVVSSASVRSARVQTWAALLAQDKLGDLCARSWTPDVSPPDSLQHDVAGWVEWLDASGRQVTGGPSVHNAVYVRRWKVQSLAADPDNARIVQVLVTTVVAGALRPGPLAARPGDAVVSTIRTRLSR